ncbi:DUF2235 domain-containing protein [Sphingopyxis sp.]|uniref:phospholipase effector Tle1 domain-containing protein n=1 Tax=Sphingopyxis sp. TaxID=1908224 RepID=UPI001DA8EB5B|nr:DUF2235 domain-containing protein [Sphingopyxis sp.]MBW8296291.1 DUF2235 domain-containing protein [Sphingopyxis sp.]
MDVTSKSCSTEGSKNILIFSDGTGQHGGVRPDQRLSNIYKMYRAMRSGFASDIDPATQVAYYDPGLGSGEGGGRIKNILSAAFGTGISQNIADCYEAILKHYRPGDRIFLFGFSRGAYTARCVANVLNLCGVPTQDKGGGPLPTGGSKLRQIAERAVYEVYEHGSGRDRAKYELEREEQARRFRADYDCAGCGLDDEEQGNVAPTFIGVFDTVAALGGVIVRRILAGLTILAVALAALSWLQNWSLAAKVASHLPAGLLIVAFLWASWKQLKVMRHPPGGRSYSWHFAKWNLKNYDRFLDTNVGFARHALAIDENRERFPYVGWGYEKDVQRVNRGDRAWLKQVWFAGNHSDIGGSYPEDESRLSDIALGWMLKELKALDNPPHANESVLRLFPDAGAMQHDEVKSSHDSRLPSFMAWKPKDRGINSQADLHASVIERFEKPAVAQYDELKPYRPTGLRQHEKVLRFYGD